MKQLFHIGLIISLLIGFSACGDDDEGCDLSQAQADANAVMDASVMYKITPIEENCIAFAALLINYIEAYEGCEGVNQSNIVDLKLAYDELPCT